MTSDSTPSNEPTPDDSNAAEEARLSAAYPKNNEKTLVDTAPVVHTTLVTGSDSTAHTKSDDTVGDPTSDKTLVEGTPILGSDGMPISAPAQSGPKSLGPEALTTKSENINATAAGTGATSGTDGEGGKPAKPKPPNGPMVLLREVAELIVVTLFLLVVIRFFLAEARYIPSSSMEPTLQIDDRLLVEKVSGRLGKPIRRGDILVFYPPPSEMPNGKDLSNDVVTLAGRLTGLPFLPYEPAFIKRVIGLPGDKIRVQRGVGVFINEQLLDEPYVKEHPNYDLNVLGDIGGRTNNGYLTPFGDSKEPIIVPAGSLFMMGDNRNNSEDSHVWGFLDQKRVIGRACLLFWRWLEPPKYPRSIESMD